MTGGPGQPGAWTDRAGAWRPVNHLDVVATGPLATVQDRGRPGYAALGVSPSGAADRSALALANRLVGNRDDAAGLEVTLGGLAVRFDADAVLAVTGAPVDLEVDGRGEGLHATVRVRGGAVVRMGGPVRGLRTYLAVRGGVAVPPVLGSRSYDVLSGIGPPPLSPGDRLPIGRARGSLPPLDAVPVAGPVPGPCVLQWTNGPRADHLTVAGREALASTRWTVDADSNRVGVRLAGPPLDRHDRGELPSEGLVRGAVQVPPSGLPLIFLADHPTTGGYPVVAVVDDADTDRLGQVRPGDHVVLRLRR